MASEDDKRRKRAPKGTLPIDETDWSGNHREIKDAIGAEAPDDVRIDLQGNVWAKLNGTWAYHGPASDYTGSGRPSGRRGRDRRGARKKEKG